MYYISRGDSGGLLEFVYLELFERTRNGLISESEMKAVEDELLENPRTGSVLVNTSGVRKVRVATDGRGKRGSTRVVYLYVENQATVHFLLAFPKNVQESLTAEQGRAVRALVARVRREPWPRPGPRASREAN